MCFIAHLEPERNFTSAWCGVSRYGVCVLAPSRADAGAAFFLPFFPGVTAGSSGSSGSASGVRVAAVIPVAPTALLEGGHAVAAVLVVDARGKIAVVGVGGGEHGVQVGSAEDHT